MKAEKKGTFVISLDFELLWGVHDHETKESFHEQSLGARKAVEEMLKLFDRYEIHATWGIVGLLMAHNKDQMERYIPTVRPQYDEKKLSAYQYLDQVGDDEQSDPYHFAYSLVSEIKNHQNQEIASHTFSHYYCKASGQNICAFLADLQSAQKIAQDKLGCRLKSLILPQNQFVEKYLDVARDAGFTVVRGNPDSFAYNSNGKIARAMRFLDTYIGVCGRKTYPRKSIYRGKLMNVRASTFFRKYNAKLGFLEKFKVAHIKREMKYAARKGQVYHLWWHPHNISQYQHKSIEQLTEIFEYYKILQKKYGFDSKNMYEAAEGSR